jgi:serine/threonine-protein kinase
MGLMAAVGASLVLLPLEPAKRAVRAVVSSDPPAPTRPLDGTSWGRYRVERRLATGGQARAFLAHDTSLDRRVVLKVVDTLGMEGNAKRAVIAEARILASIDHPHVTKVFDVLETESEAILVLEYVSGGTLRDRLRNGALPQAEAVLIFDGIVAGLAAVHARGIVHCDLKPENVLLTPDGVPKLSDFGIARIAPGARTISSETPSEGTPTYMSPEQAHGARVGPTSDIYSAAVLFHEMLSGTDYMDFRGLDAMQIRAKIASGTPRIGRECGPYARIILSCLAKDGSQRPPTAATLRASLAQVPTTRA